MKAALVSMALLLGQMVTMQPKPVVHLATHKDNIPVGFNACLLELDHAPAYIHLPAPPPPPDAQGQQWTVDIKNFGPLPVTVMDAGHFKALIAVKETVHINSTGTSYVLKH